MRRWLLAVAAVAILAGVAVVGGLLAVVTGQVPGVTRLALEKTLARLLDADVRIERFEGSLLREFTLQGARVESPGGGAVGIARLHAALDTEALADGRLVFDALDVDGLSLRLRARRFREYPPGITSPCRVCRRPCRPFHLVLPARLEASAVAVPEGRSRSPRC